MKKTTKPAAKKPRKPKPSTGPEVPPMAGPRIVNDLVSLVMARHIGGVNLEALPPEAWPAPSPVELASVTGACGWAGHSDGAAKAMALLWQCAEVIHESRESAARFLDSIRLKNEWTAAELRKACGFDYQKLPDRISRADFFSLFYTEDLQVKKKTLSGWNLFHHWHSLPDGGGIPLKDAEAWKARHKAGFECARFTFFERWDALAMMVARFNEWRKTTGRENIAGGKKNLKQNQESLASPCEEIFEANPGNFIGESGLRRSWRK